MYACVRNWDAPYGMQKQDNHLPHGRMMYITNDILSEIFPYPNTEENNFKLCYSRPLVISSPCLSVKSKLK